MSTPTSPPLTALITGASSGIGEAIARCFARDGHRLVLVARSEDRLRALAETLQAVHGTHGTHGTRATRVDVLPADLSRPGAAAALASALRRRRRPIDVLVNNAGVLEQGAFSAIAAGRHQQLIDLNVSALTAMLAAFLPAMLARGRGRILNVASIAAFQPVPGLATYAATKAYVLSLTESLAEELRGSGVSVTALCPGITATAMLGQATARNTKLAQLPGFLIGDVEAVAAEGYRACLAGEVLVVPGAVNQAVALASGATPRPLLRRLAGVLGRAAI